MTRTMRSHELHVSAWLSASELQPHIDRFIGYSRECGYSQSTVRVEHTGVAFQHAMSIACNDPPCTRKCLYLQAFHHPTLRRKISR